MSGIKAGDVYWEAVIKTGGFKRDMAEANQEVQKTKKGLDFLGGSIAKQALGMAGLGSVTAIVSGGFRAYTEEIKASSVAIQNNVNSMRGLMSLGRNALMFDSLRKDVVNYSNALGIAGDQIADTMFNIQSGASYATKEVRDSILQQSAMLNKLTGTDLPIATEAVTKFYNIYREEVGSVIGITDKLMFAADQGFLTFGHLARFGPRVASTFKGLGYSMDDLTASMIVATQEGGSVEDTFTGLRAVAAKMNDAVELGLVPNTKDLVEQLTALQNVPADVLQDVFGQEAASTLFSLVGNVEGLKAALESLANMDFDAVGQKYRDMISNITVAFTEAQKQIEAMRQNEALTDTSFKLRGIGTPEEMRPESNQYEQTIEDLSQQYIRDQLPTGLKWTAGGIERAQYAGTNILGMLFDDQQKFAPTRDRNAAKQIEKIAAIDPKAAAPLENIMAIKSGAGISGLGIGEAIARNKEAQETIGKATQERMKARAETDRTMTGIGRIMEAGTPEAEAKAYAGLWPEAKNYFDEAFPEFAKDMQRIIEDEKIIKEIQDRETERVRMEELQRRAIPQKSPQEQYAEGWQRAQTNATDWETRGYMDYQSQSTRVNVNVQNMNVSPGTDTYRAITNATGLRGAY